MNIKQQLDRYPYVDKHTIENANNPFMDLERMARHRDVMNVDGS